MAQSAANNIPADSCNTCFTKHNRVRPSLCQCKHCSNAFCFDCMKGHNDEIQENIAEAFNRYNELKLLSNDKKKFIKDETHKSKEQVSEWLRKYIDNLNVEKARIDKDIENAEKEEQTFVDAVEAKLQAVSTELGSFTKTNTFQSTRMEELLNEIKEFTRRVNSLTVTREYDLPSTMPKYKLKFEQISEQKTNDTSQARTTIENPKQKEEKVQFEMPNPQTHSTSDTESDICDSNEETTSDADTHERTTYVIDCMASDGINIMYSVIEHDQHDLIAYCYLDVNARHYNQEDPCRPWLLSRIIDMIWWRNIDKFVCGTENGICTVEYKNRHFKILTVIHNQWIDVRIGANTNSLWVHENGKILIYDVNFKLTRTIDFEIPSVIMRASFCVTNNIVAFLVIRADQNNPSILQAQFFNCDMIKIRSFDIGSMKAPCMVRTDGNHRFFIAAGRSEFYSISPRGGKRTVSLQDEANCLAILNGQRIAFTGSRAEVELANW